MFYTKSTRVDMCLGRGELVGVAGFGWMDCDTYRGKQQGVEGDSHSGLKGQVIVIPKWNRPH